MGASLDRRALVWPAAIAGLAVLLGLAAGVDPRIGVAGALGLAFVLLVLMDLTAGLCLFVVVSFLDVTGGGGGLSFSKVVGLLLALSWLAVLTTRSRRDGDFLAAHPALTMLMLLFTGWALLSMVWSEDLGRAASSTQRYALNFLLVPIVFTAVRRPRHVTWVAAAFVGGAVLTTLYGMATGDEVAVGSDASRLAGGIGESNELATVLVIAIVLSLALVLSRRTPLAIRAGALVAVPLALAGIALTLSRAGLVALLVSLVAGIAVGGRWRGWFALALVVLGVGVGVWFTTFAPPQDLARVQSTNSTGRTDIWTVGWRMVEAHPIHGVGAGNFPVSSIHYLLVPGVIARDDFIIDTPKVAHDVYLEVQSELGVVGLVLFLAVLGSCLRCALLAARRFQAAGDARMEMLARAVLISLAGVLAADVFASEQYSKQLWLLLALGPALLAMAPAPAERRLPA